MMNKDSAFTINRLRINSYGKIKEKSLDLTSGINIIYGENEAGKSTVMAFIRAMLFGFGDSRSKLKSDRVRFAPWSGEALSGEVSISLADGKNYLISREAGRTKAADKERIIRAETGEREDINLPQIIGIGENGFNKTFYISQLGAQISAEGEDEVAQRLINLSQSGGEDDNAAAAIERLRAARRHFKHYQGDGGRINEIRGRIAKLLDELKAAKTERDSFFADRARLSSLNKEIKEGEENLAALSAQIAAALRREAAKEREERAAILKSAEEKLSLERERANELGQSLKELKAFEAAPDEIIFLPSADTEREERAVALSKKKRGRFFLASLILVFICAPLSVLAAVKPLFWAFAALAGAGALIVFLLFLKARSGLELAAAALKQAGEHESARLSELGKFGCASLKEYTDKKARYVELLQGEKFAAQNLSRLEAEVETAKAALKTAEDDPQIAAADSPAPPSDGPRAAELIKMRDEQKVRAEKARLAAAALDARLSALTGELRPIYILEAKISEAGEELESAQNALRAIEMALLNMNEALAQIRKSFGPRLNARAADILRRITGDKRGKLMAAANYSVLIDDGGFRELDYFSAGTVEQVYFSLRLSIIDMLFPDKKPPLILDDPFAQYDEARERGAFEILGEYGGQVILFTCRKPAGREFISLSV